MSLSGLVTSSLDSCGEWHGNIADGGGMSINTTLTALFLESEGIHFVF